MRQGTGVTGERRAAVSRTPGLPADRPVHPPGARWEQFYRTSVITADMAATVLVVLGSSLVLLAGDPAVSPLGLAGLPVVSVLAVASCLGLSGAWHAMVLGQGAEEFRTLGRGLAGAVVVLGLGALVFGIHDAQLWVFTVVPVTGAVAFPTRYVLRRLLHRARNEGRCLLPVLAAGSPESIRDLLGRTRAAPHVGWRVEALCTPDGHGEAGSAVDGVPVIGAFTDIAEQVCRGGYRMVAVTPDRYWTPNRLQQLGWDLEGTGAAMVVASGLMDLSGPRLRVSGVLGMPMLWVSEATFTGLPRVLKELVDRLCAAVLVFLLAPLMLAIAASVALGSRGPVFYRQRRIGKNGTAFTILKFRTMVVGADSTQTTEAGRNDGAGPLFKLRKDPRVTKVGTLLRRYSLDELPQLLNVLGGSMSLVGPRPPLPAETERYEPYVRRRLLVKPGVTGLWQVSGRSDLPWDEAVRLDLRYVEDWSLALDAVILWKTVRAVLSGNGAY